MQLAKRDLFGGAITIELPQDNLVDASDLREVPDTQEVFLHADSTVSWVIEILQRVGAQDASDAARFHFDSLAHDNDAEQSEVVGISIPSVSSTPSATPAPIVLTGWQTVAKYNRTVPDKVKIMLALYRLDRQNIDLVLTVNLPHVLADGSVTASDIIDSATSAFEAVANSLNIVDFGLFAS
ncbi:Mog1p/PsbP-like protein [Auriculariales sp. MPI-PUGE-AT-0066]|nr:Mog1p/PsbP-like protein [Auriculariales sp. MPI-PUGE-AT-0066]